MSISQSRAKEICYVLGVYRGTVIAVFNVSGYIWLKVDDELGNEFKRNVALKECWKTTHLINKDVTDYRFGTGFTFRYICGCDVLIA